MKKIKKKETFSKRLNIVFFILITILLTTSIGGCATVQTNVQAREIKEAINNLAISPNNKKVMFDRCRGQDCQIQVYDLESGELSAYQPPPNEEWAMGKYSDDGKKIVFYVGSTNEKESDVTQIAVMDVDGKNFRKITSGPYPKINPVFSHSGKKVLYIKAGFIKTKGRKGASRYDAWEVDIETGKETRLTYFEYMYMGNLSYFADDKTIIYEAMGPLALPGHNFPKDKEGNIKDIKTVLRTIDEEQTKRKISLDGILTVKRGDTFPQNPYTIFEKGHPPKRPLLSKDGKLYFEPDGRSGALYLYSPDGNHKFIVLGGSVSSWALSPDGVYLGIEYRDSIIINRVDDNSKYCSILLPHFKISSEQLRKKPYLKMLPETPSLIIINGEKIRKTDC